MKTCTYRAELIAARRRHLGQPMPVDFKAKASQPEKPPWEIIRWGTPSTGGSARFSIWGKAFAHRDVSEQSCVHSGQS